MMADVVVIGCGPVGALAANLLGRAGLSVVVLEKEREHYPLPRAVHIDHEMLRLFQSAGVIDAVLPDMIAADGHLHVQDGAGVTVRYAQDGAEHAVRARWVIAADGSRSSVRKALDAALGDLDFEEPWLVVDAEVAGPVTFPAITGLPQGADLQRLSVMMCDPARPATIVPGRGNHRRWEFMLLPGEDDAAMMAPAKVGELVGAWMKDVPHTIVRAATYRFHGLVAEQWQAGRVFLAGDAAHQTPPFFGQGMCHGLRDVANDGADEALLATYQPERDPHVRAVIGAAVGAGRYICELGPARAAARDAAMAHIAGYAVFNDASVRDWQRHNIQFTPGKNFPATGGFGPELVTPDEIGDLAATRVQTRLNGELVQDQPLSDLIWDIPFLIAYCSTFTELAPGDVIVTGTPGGVGDKRQPPLYMKAGDRVEVSVGAIGTLSNPIIEEI